jgi:hypothetical protein
VATVTSKRIGEAEILNFLGTNAYSGRSFREYLSWLFPLSKVSLLHSSDKRL